MVEKKIKTPLSKSTLPVATGWRTEELLQPLIPVWFILIIKPLAASDMWPLIRHKWPSALGWCQWFWRTFPACRSERWTHLQREVLAAQHEPHTCSRKLKALNTCGSSDPEQAGAHGHVFNLEAIDPVVRSALTSRGANPSDQFSNSDEEPHSAQQLTLRIQSYVLHWFIFSFFF